MRVHVVKLRHRGRRFPRQRILGMESVEGRLGLISMPDERGFPVRLAVLRDLKASVNSCLAELYQPEIMAITSQALLLKGVERGPEGVETVQEWWCRFPPL